MKDDSKKLERVKFRQSKPVEYIFRDVKNFDTLEHFLTFIKKRKAQFLYNNSSLFGLDSHYLHYCHVIDFRNTEIESEWVNYNNGEELTKAIDDMRNTYLICNQDYNIQLAFSIKRKENAKELKDRMDDLQRLSQLSTKELLSLRRCHGHGYNPGITLETLKSVLDTREHITNSKERKAQRIAKAKLQKTY
jgi:hypothetical protein